MFFSVLVVFICAQLTSADYANPPDWENDPYFTHQSWSFDTQQANPMAPDDGGAGNPYGTASFNMTAGSSAWVDDLGPVHSTDVPYPWIEDRQGGWQVSGPSTGETWFTIEIPNDENANLIKEVWFEQTFKVTDLGHLQTIVSNVQVDVYADGIIDDAHKFAYHGELTTQEVIGLNPFDGGFWARIGSIYSFAPQPGSETVIMVGYMNAGQYGILDQIDVDTHCIPEPATVLLLGLGGLALLRKRRA